MNDKEKELKNLFVKLTNYVDLYLEEKATKEDVNLILDKTKNLYFEVYGESHEK